MTAKLELQRTGEWRVLRGFMNLLRKENRAWWGTRRWWTNALLWSGALGGLVSVMLFMLPAIAATQDTPEVAAAGGPVAYGIQMGIVVFFKMGCMALAMGTIVLSLDLILDERHSGVLEWLLAKPVARRAYVLAKLTASTVAVLVLLVILPSLVMYLLLSISTGSPYNLAPFLGAVGILTVHTIFYLTLTLMLATLFNNRTPILGIALASAMGGTVIGGFIKPLRFITPWMLGNTAEMVARGLSVPPEFTTVPVIATALWSVVFIGIALAKFEKMEF